jgi:hypothetical protein
VNARPTRENKAFRVFKIERRYRMQEFKVFKE